MLRAGMVSAMLGCLTLALISIPGAIVENWDGTWIVCAGVVAAVEAYVSFQVVPRDLSAPIGRLHIRFLEAIVLFAIIQFGVDLSVGQLPFVDWIPQVDAVGVGLGGLVILIWLVAGNVSYLLGLLDQPLEATPGYATPARRLSLRFLAGGVLIFSAAAVTQPVLSQALHLPNAPVSGPVFNVLLYFLLGITLLGHVNYAALRQRWQAQHVTVARGLSGRWVRYCLIFIALVALLAVLLPTSSTVDALNQGRGIWEQMILLTKDLFTQFWQLVPRPKNLILPRKPPPNIHLPPLPRPHRTPPHHGGGGGTNGLGLLRLLMFWGLVLVVLVYGVRAFFRRERGSHALRIPFLAALRLTINRLLGSVRQWLRSRLASLATHLPERLALRTPTLFRRLPHYSSGRVGGRTPHEQVLRYYRTVLRSAARQGYQRRSAQTPQEYSARLQSRLGEVHTDFQHLTDAFVAARYSRHAVTEADADRAHAYWARVRTALRQRHDPVTADSNPDATGQ